MLQTGEDCVSDRHILTRFVGVPSAIKQHQHWAVTKQNCNIFYQIAFYHAPLPVLDPWQHCVVMLCLLQYLSWHLKVKHCLQLLSTINSQMVAEEQVVSPTMKDFQLLLAQTEQQIKITVQIWHVNGFSINQTIARLIKPLIVPQQGSNKCGLS